jgi:hypothetical protein
LCHTYTVPSSFTLGNVSRCTATLDTAAYLPSKGVEDVRNDVEVQDRRRLLLIDTPIRVVNAVCIHIQKSCRGVVMEGNKRNIRRLR